MNPQYSQQQQPIIIQQEAPQQAPQPRYEYRDMTENMGSIIKDLTDTKELLDNYELRLRGKRKDSSGKIIEDETIKPRILSDMAAKEFVDIIRGVVNRHNDFSYYTQKDANNIVMRYNYTINLFLMKQGMVIHRDLREQLSSEALSMIFASVHKAVEGKMLHWTKGSFTEGMQRVEAGEKKGILDYILPGRRKRAVY